MISVLIPCYNHRDFIEKTLDSIYENDFKDKEIVIINDGSKDDSHQIISNWISKHKDEVKITYKNRENRGLNATVNELLSLAKGEFVTFVDSDDFLLPDSLAKRYEYLQKNPDKKIVFADGVLVDKENKILYDSVLFDFRGYDKDSFSSSEKIRKTLLKRFVLAGPMMMARKEIYEKIGYHDESLLAWDLEFYVKTMPTDWIGFLDEKVFAYRTHGSNQSLVNISSRLLKDSAKTFWDNKDLYKPSDRVWVYWNVFKFLLRAKLAK